MVALKTAVAGITDSLNSESMFENCKFIDNKIISFDEFLLFIPPDFRPVVVSEAVFVLRRISVGAKYNNKIMKGNLVIKGCEFDDEMRMLDIYLANVTIINSTIKNRAI